jgi:Zn-dependent metalloprotease
MSVKGVLLLVVSSFTLIAPVAHADDRDERVQGARVKAEARIARRATGLGLFDTRKQLREISATPTAGSVIFRYQQLHDGIPVYGGQLIVKIGRSREHETSTLVLPLSVRVKPTIDASTAADAALRALALKGEVRPPQSELVVLPNGSLGDGKPSGDRLAWQVGIAATNDEDGLVACTVFVDAHTRTVLATLSDLRHVTYYVKQAQFRGMYTDHFGRYVTITKGKNGAVNAQYVQDPCFGTSVALPGGGNVGVCGSPENPDGTGSHVAAGLGNWVGNANGRVTTNVRPMTFLTEPFGDGLLGSSNPATIAADAYLGLYQTHLYLYYRHGRAGLNGSNGPAVRAVVRHPTWPSSWFGPDRAVIVAAGYDAYYDQGSIDVIAHELGHGLSDFGPQLKFGTGLESEALAESTSNMLALLVSRFSAGLDLKPYRIGEETATMSPETFALTYMDDPSLKTGTVACYTSSIGGYESHRAAGPADHMFYLLVYGGVSKCNGNVVSAVGLDAAEKIWFEGYFDLAPTANYAALRAAFVDAAMNRYGSTSVTANTIAAFDAVNVP